MRIDETKIKQIVLGEDGYLLIMKDGTEAEVGYSTNNVLGLLDITKRLDIDVI